MKLKDKLSWVVLIGDGLTILGAIIVFMIIRWI